MMEKDPVIAELRISLVSKDAILKNLQEQMENPDEPSEEVFSLRNRIEEDKEKLQTRAKGLIPVLEEAARYILAEKKDVPTPADKTHEEIFQAKLDRETCNAELESLQKSFQQAVSSLQKFNQGGSMELSILRQEVERLKRIHAQLGQKLDEWNIESQAPQRVQTINEPIVTKIR